MGQGRRKFLKKIGVFSSVAGIPLLSNATIPQSVSSKLLKLAEDKVPAFEDFWSWVRQSYTASTNIINLNNGGVSPQPKVVQEAFKTYNRIANDAPSYYMWRIQDKGRIAIRQQLANLAGCSKEEIIINRNTTEALDTIIFGLNLEKGDEVVMTNFDYPNMVNAWKQRVQRDGIVLKEVKLNLPEENVIDLVEKFRKQLTPKTKIVHITHIINWTGQIMPVKEIAKIAHDAGAEVIVDGAHSFAQLDFKIPDLNCDYFGTSLHKWLCAPFGTGMLYVKKDKISALWPSSPTTDPQSGSIIKFEALGTRSSPSEQAIGSAVSFHNSIGTKRKENRLRFLKNYWVDQVKDLEKVTIHTSSQAQFSCAIANFQIEGIEPKTVEAKLFKDYRIHSVSIDHQGIKGVRITPHIYTSIGELDLLISAIQKMAG